MVPVLPVGPAGKIVPELSVPVRRIKWYQSLPNAKTLEAYPPVPESHENP